MRLSKQGDTFHISIERSDGTSGEWGDCLPLAPAGEGMALTVDLRDLSFADPLFLIRLRGFIDYHCSRGHAVTVIPPDNYSVRNYLSRMRVAKDLPSNCSFPLPSVNENERGEVLIPIRRLNSNLDSDRLDDEIARLIQAQFSGPLGSVVGAFSMTISEMCDNATTHGSSGAGAYVCAQRYSEGRCAIAIGDLGIGIPAHMRARHGELEGHDGQVIAHATQARVSGTGDRDRGFGYQNTIDELQATELRYGNIRVWSSGGRFVYRAVQGEELERMGMVAPYVTEGTWVSVQIGA